MINRRFFYQQICENLFPDGLSATAIEGHNALLDYWEAHHAKDDDRWLAYILATAYHETAHTLRPLRETKAVSDEQAAERLERSYQRGRLPWVRKPYWRKDADGKYWYGRGFVQLTHKSNYKKMSKYVDEDLVEDPDKALDMTVAVKIIVIGMIGGHFTGAALPSYFSKQNDDWVGARAIVNGLESANKIASYGYQYYSAISYTT